MDKFAIFRNNETGGLFAAYYIDEEKDAPPYVNPSHLPIVMNRSGGYTSFSTEYECYNSSTFVEIRNGDDIDDVLTFEERFPDIVPYKYGFISPSGDAYSCGYQGHSSLAEALVEKVYNEDVRNPERFLEDRGWIKILSSFGDDDKLMIGYGREYLKLSKKQCDKIIELGLFEGNPRIARQVSYSMED